MRALLLTGMWSRSLGVGVQINLWIRGVGVGKIPPAPTPQKIIIVVVKR